MGSTRFSLPFFLQQLSETDSIRQLLAIQSPSILLLLLASSIQPWTFNYNIPPTSTLPTISTSTPPSLPYTDSIPTLIYI